MDKKRKKSGNGGIIAFIVVILLSLLTNLESREVFQFFILLIPVAIFVLVFFIVRTALKKGNKGGQGGTEKKRGYTPSYNFSKKEQKLEDSPFTATRMDRNISYNDRAAEENFLRDREKRIKQLDVFLKNGIIERDEYRLLKERYEK